MVWSWFWKILSRDVPTWYVRDSDNSLKTFKSLFKLRINESIKIQGKDRLILKCNNVINEYKQLLK